MPAAAAIPSSHTIAGYMAVRYPGKSAQATNVTVTTVRPGTPTGLAAGTTTSVSIALSWTGTAPTSAFRVLRKSGSFPTGPTDGAATIVYDGPNTSTTAAGLSASTTYFFAVFGKASFSATDTYSSAASQVSASTTAAAATTWHVNVTTGS